MKLSTARGIFHLRTRVSIDELKTRFRALVKKYHPDKLKDYPIWADERIKEINEAYEILSQWVSQPPESETPKVNEENHGKEDVSDSKKWEYSPTLTNEASEMFYKSFYLFLEGLGVYFEYGLENPLYRKEGVRRFRYRKALYTMKKAYHAVHTCAVSYNHPVIIAVLNFIRLMLQDINFGQINYPANNSGKKMDRKMEEARKNFNICIKNFFFPEMVQTYLKTQIPIGLSSSYAEFILYLSFFDKGERQKIGILQIKRYEAFITLTEIYFAGKLKL